MNILVISQRKILPAIDGGRIFSLGLLKYLKEYDADITFVSFTEEDDYSLSERKELLRYVSAIHTCPLRWKSTALNLSFEYPNNIRKYTRKAMFNIIKKIKQIKNYELVIIDHLQMFEYTKLFPVSRIVLCAHNVESDIWIEFANKCSGLMRYFVLRSAKMTIEYEKKSIARADGIVAISEEDLNSFRNMVPEIKGAVMPVYNKLNRIKRKEDVFDCSNKIVFIGSYGWYPNQTAARFLALELLPLLQKRIPDIKLFLVGKDPTDEICSYSSNPNIIVTGTVDSVDPYIIECDIFVNAVIEGSGVNIKMIEAMGKGIPIVSSDFGTRGINIHSGKEILVYHNTSECAELVVKLLEDRESAYEMTERARGFYEQYIIPNDLVKKVIFGD